MTRRLFLSAGATAATALTAGPVLAQQPAPVSPAPRVKGPRVWLDMDQAELDAAYDQAVHAPNLQQVVKRWENILFLFFHWKRLDQVLHQRAAVVDAAPGEIIEVRQAQ